MENQKVLVVYFSRTGTVRKVANSIKERYNGDIEEIIDLKDRRGIIGYIKSGRDALNNRLTEIKDINKDVSSYDMVFVCSPVWASHMTPAARTFLTRCKDTIKKVSFVCVQAGDEADKVLKSLEDLVGKRPEKTMSIKRKYVLDGSYMNQINKL